MKAAFLYVLLFCSWFLGARQPLQANEHTSNSLHCRVTKQLHEKDRLIDAEDQDDEDDLTRTVASAAKWLSTFNLEILLCGSVSFSNVSPNGSHSYTGRNIYIVQRVLKI